MAELDEGFAWRVCDAGYEVVTVEAPKPKKTRGRGMPPATSNLGLGEPVPGVRIRPKGKRFRTKYPLQFNTSLYRDFAALDGSAEACVDFANKVGLLTCEADAEGEPLSLWQGQIKKMQRAIERWLTDPLTLGVNEKGEIKVGDLVAVLRPTPPDGKLAMRVGPRHLLGGMELQLGAAVGKGHELKHCKQCNQLFEIGPGAKRSHAEFCTPKCQTDFNNAKKRRTSQ